MTLALLPRLGPGAKIALVSSKAGSIDMAMRHEERVAGSP
jgi:hypothetical protein